MDEMQFWCELLSEMRQHLSTYIPEPMGKTSGGPSADSERLISKSSPSSGLELVMADAQPGVPAYFGVRRKRQRRWLRRMRLERRHKEKK